MLVKLVQKNENYSRCAEIYHCFKKHRGAGDKSRQRGGDLAAEKAHNKWLDNVNKRFKAYSRSMEDKYHADNIAVHIACIVGDKYAREAVKMHENYHTDYPYRVFAETVYGGKILPAKSLDDTLQNDLKVDKRHDREHFYKRFADKAVRGTQYLSDIFAHDKQHSRNKK